MKSIFRILSSFFFLSCFWLSIFGDVLYRNDVSNFFHETNFVFAKEKMVTDPVILQRAARRALLYFDSKISRNIQISHPVAFEKIVSAKTIKETLKFIINVIESDKRTGKFRILNTDFLNKNFKLVKWSGDADSAYKNKVIIPESHNNGRIPEGQIRLTNYAIFIVNGSYRKTKRFPYALYAIKDKNFETSGRFKYSKQHVLSGGLNNIVKQGKIKPLAWLSRDGLEDAIMQGSLLVRMPDNEYKLFNVDKDNGFEYDKKLKEAKLQKKYWYFKEIRDRKNNGIFLNLQDVVFAGDVDNIGLGKIIAIRYINPITKKKEVRLGIIADYGIALKDNLYQLDLFTGVFRSKNKFKQRISNSPNAVEAYILVKS